MDSTTLMLKIGFQAGSAIVKNRSPIIDFFSDKAKGMMSTDVVVTGTPGVGKSIFINKVESFLKEKYPVKPGLSNDIEINVIRVNDDFFPKKIVVIPGQGGREQNDAFRNLITNNKKLLGIVHVVDFGYTKPRSDMSELQYIASGIDSVDKLRAQFLEKEIEYFKELCFLIKGSGSNVKWLHVVINKIDLFSQSLNDAVNHYNHSDGFGSLVKDLSNNLGRDFKVDFSFAISSRDNLKFNNEIIHSIVNEKMSEEVLLKSFLVDLSSKFN
ncbi:GTPase [Citrobacter pasteurii]|uniref:GTPase n=1 Tax=Citrobacter pasteurii TaxID=1563222 RepID=UPI00352C6E7B